MTNVNKLHVSNQTTPRTSQAYPFTFLLDSAGAYTLDLTLESQRGVIQQIQAGFFDNSENSQALSITFGISAFQFKLAPYSQGWLPIVAPNPPVLTFSGAANGFVSLTLVNVPMPAAIWSTIAAKGPSYTAAAGAAQAIAVGGTAVDAITGPVNGGYITNPSTAVEKLYVDPVTTATTTEGGTCIGLAAGQTFVVPPLSGNVSTNAVTGGHSFSVVKW